MGRALVMLLIGVVVFFIAYRFWRSAARAGHDRKAKAVSEQSTIPAAALKSIGTQENFEAIVIEASSQKPVLVDFWASWCGPCLALSPVLDEIATHYGERMRVVTVDIDTQKTLAERFQIRSIPCVILFRGGRKVDGFVGLRTRRQVEWMVAQHLPREESAEA